MYSLYYFIFSPLFPILELQCAVQFLKILLQKYQFIFAKQIFRLEVSVKHWQHGDLVMFLQNKDY